MPPAGIIPGTPDTERLQKRRPQNRRVAPATDGKGGLGRTRATSHVRSGSDASGRRRPNGGAHGVFGGLRVCENRL